MTTPPKLVYDSNTYLTLSLPTGSSLPAVPSQSDTTDSPTSTHSSSELRNFLTYVGPVGQLSDSHIFSLPIPTANPPQEEVKDVQKWLEQQKGVTDVEVLIPKMRSGRKTF